MSPQHYNAKEIVGGVAAFAVLLLGASVLFGWAIDSLALKRVMPGFVTMNPLTAACFVASAIALWLSASNSRSQRRICLGLAAIVFVVCCWKLASDLGAPGPAPDSIMFARAVREEIPLSQMAPSTALGFILVAIALAFTESADPRRRSAAQYLAFALGCIALFAAVGYMYGAGADRALKPFSLMALHTSWGLLLLAVGLLSKHVDTGWMSLAVGRDAAGNLLRLMLPAAIGVPIMLGWLCIEAQVAGYFGAPLALTLLASLSVAIFVLMTFATASLIQAADQERLRRHEALRASEARISAILSIAADAIFTIDGRHRITLFNAWAEKTFGYERKEVMGRPFHILFPERSQADESILLLAAGDQNGPGGAERQEILARRKSGSEFPAEATVSKVEIEGETIYTVVLRDMTESRKAAEVLVRAKEEAESAARTKSEFLANMSHEIRTPLNSISGFAQLLLEHDDLPVKPRDKVQKIRNATSALITIVNDILDYSKLEEGKLSLSLRSFSPAQLANNCVSIMGSIADRLDLPINISVPDELAHRFYIGDPHRLQQILLNLLSNAVKFTRSGSITIRIEEEAGEASLALLRISVVDTGIGIRPEQMQRLFKRFSQGDSSVSRVYGGTGLGLAICERLVSLMGGQIGVESKPGNGSTFWFQIPLSCAPEEAVSRNLIVKEERCPAAARSILLVEDMEINREIASAMLERAGHRVDVATDGAEAVKMVAAKRYDLVLMDIQMPNMDGITATERIRAMTNDKGSVPIVAMTANVLPEEVERFYAAGMQGHIRKPVDLADLLAEVERSTAEGPRAVA